MKPQIKILAGVLLAISTSASAQGVQCLPCPAGTYSGGASTSCTPCPIGTYQDSIGAASCKTCASLADSDQVGMTECPTGCAGGQYANGTVCITCPPGSYCPKGVANPMPCTSGNYCPESSSLPVPCSAGTYQQNAGAASCTTCPSDYHSLAGASACTKCTSYTKGPIYDNNGYNWYFGNKGDYIYCKFDSSGACVLDSSQSTGGCKGYAGPGYNDCAVDNSNGATLREQANRFCKNGGSF
jgi:hypothetical protein